MRRLALGALLVCQRVGQCRLAEAFGTRLELGDVLVRQADCSDFNVRLDSCPLDRAACRRVVARRGQAHSALARSERQHGLHRALAERGRPHDHCALAVLQRAGDDLGRGGRTAIHKHHDRYIRESGGADSVVAALVALATAAGRDDFAAIDEARCDLDRGLEKSARIITQVEHEALEAAAHVLAHLLKAAVERLHGLLVEGGDAQIADIADGFRLDDFRPDDFAGQRHIERFDILAHDGDVDGRADRAAHLLHGIVQRQADDGLAIDGGEKVARLDPGARSRRAVHRGHDLHEAVLRCDLDAEAAILAGRLRLHVLEVIGVEIGGVRVKRGQHAVDRSLDRFGRFKLGHVIGLGLGQDVGEQVELLKHLRLLRGLVRRHGEGRNTNRRGEQTCTDYRGQPPFAHAALLLCQRHDVTTLL